MTPLQRFSEAVTHACKLFHIGRGVCAWLMFYEAKQAAYSQLIAALPQVTEIQDFWRYVQNMPVAQWMPLIEAEVKRIRRKRSLCHDCSAVKISWPERLCPECKQERRLDTYKKAKERKRARQEMRKCPRCKNELLSPHQKVCRRCQGNARRERNRRYQKSLKERKLRRFQDDFTKGALSTIPASQLATPVAGNVEQQGVLVGGAK